MSVAINKVIIAGNLTRDPQVKFLANEKAVASFGIAINRRYKDASGAQKEDVTFVDIEAWGRTAELCGQYLAKGRACFIEGRLKLDTWDDKKDGSKRSKLTVVADSVQFLDSVKKDGQAPAGEPQSDPAPSRPARPAAAAGGGGGDDSDPPFTRHEDWSW
jgi:single-strand DNA-binding protein